MKPHRGVTLIELMVTIAIAAIMLAIGIPSFQAFFTNNRIATAAIDLTSDLNMARSEAVRRGLQVSVRNSNGGGDWGGGWTMFVDSDRDGALDAGEETLRVGAATSGGVTIRGSGNYSNFIAFTPAGRSNLDGRFAVCHDNTLAGAKIVIVNGVGRIRGGLDGTGNNIPETDAGTDLTSCTNP